jgi:hypothetical protein
VTIFPLFTLVFEFPIKTYKQYFLKIPFPPFFSAFFQNCWLDWHQIQLEVEKMMKKKMKLAAFLMITIITAFSAGIGVLADDDEHEKKEHRYYEDHEQHGWFQGEDEEKYEREYEDEDDEFYEENDRGWAENEMQQTMPQKQGYWNFWIRAAIASPANNLPISVPGDAAIIINGNPGTIHVIPHDGQLLVSGKEMAKLLGAKTEFYTKSRILVMKKDNTELIVRAGSNAAYENNNKTPMPTEAQYIEKSLYLPISVAANALGYRVSWNEEEQSLILENL